MRFLFLFIGPLLTSTAFSQVSDSVVRHVVLQGAVNFRDLGGYATTDGHHVKWHVIYRSADISKLTQADLDTLKARHILYDVDLRGVQESAKAPDKMNPGTDYILCPAGSDSMNGAMFRDLSKVSDGDSLMNIFYSTTAYLTPRYKPFFGKLLILPGDDALLFHCTAGKDRTGIAAALLLYALGVPYQTIKEDYEATNYYRSGGNEQMIKGIMTTMRVSEHVARAMMGAKGSYLDTTFEAIRVQYGSVDRYLAEQLGLDQAKLVILKAKYLE
jgi:protein-tyrosine phosphatase